MNEQAIAELNKMVDEFFAADQEKKRIEYALEQNETAASERMNPDYESHCEDLG